MKISAEEIENLHTLLNTRVTQNIELAVQLVQGLGLTWAEIGVDEDYLLKILGTGVRKNISFARKIIKIAQFQPKELLKRRNFERFGFATVTDFETQRSLHLHDENCQDLSPLEYLQCVSEIELHTSKAEIGEALPLMPALKKLIVYTTWQGNLDFVREKFPNLELLIVIGSQHKNSNLVDLGALSGLKKLKFLEIKKHPIQTIHTLANLPALTILHLESTKIANLQGWETSTFPKLSQFTLAYSPLTSLSGFPSCPNLQILELPHNQLLDLKGLPKLPKLDRLNIEKNQLADLEGIAQMPNLYQLYAQNNRIVSVQALSGLKRLRELFLQKNQIRDFAPLEGLSQLQTVDILDNPAPKAFLLHKLECLSLLFTDRIENWSKSPEDLDYFQKIPANIYPKILHKFRQLTFATDRAALAKKPYTTIGQQLEQVSMNKKKLADLDWLELFPRLSWLACANNKIKNLGVLTRFPLTRNRKYLPFTYLDLNQNQLQDLSPLENCAHLTFLNCARNPISQLFDFSKLKKIAHLDISHTQVQHLEQLAGLEKLEYLDISNTQIADLQSLSDCTALKILKCRNAPIANLRPLLGLKLSNLYIGKKQFSKEAIAEFVQANPNCYIKLK
jgi:internalin A